MSASEVVRTRGLTKEFAGGLVAVDGIDLQVRQGDLFGFLGPNGAGKTTTIRMLLGLTKPTSGSIEVLGHDVARHAHDALQGVGTLVEGPAFYPYLSGTRNLIIFDGAGAGGARRTRRTRVREVIERVGLTDVGDRPVKAYSLGMRQRLGLASALLRTPRLLVLDEPTNGLDAQGIHELRTMFVDLVRDGTTIMLSSHLLAEVELICTRAAMMSSGRIVAQDDVAEMLAPTGWVRITTPDPERALRTLQDGPFGYQQVGPEVVRVNMGDRPPELLNRAFVQADIRVRELVVERPTLEDVFLERTGHGDIR
ncbi:MAG: ABC transporter ATP-binding protein [Ilumatobacteraceae bacterium]